MMSLSREIALVLAAATCLPNIDLKGHAAAIVLKHRSPSAFGSLRLYRKAQVFVPRHRLSKTKMRCCICWLPHGVEALS
ncbi:hypothetical protein BDV98DRAFT_259599 [Pterulicium gracile]|uniref:Uncharacterized protein n=1 Tax=Pterulicium gracile TaxID=1884261 RepID=A0A5C3Q621_9AGAR|nr:hypothetical protein BDV98DRAFT_259599 [Pterula gracilis]